VTQDRFDMTYVHVWDINMCFEIAMTSHVWDINMCFEIAMTS